MIGRFVEDPGDRHVGLRQAVLRHDPWYPCPEGIGSRGASADDLGTCAGRLTVELQSRGAALLELDRALSNWELIELASALGTPLEQPNPRTQPWVEDGVILNLRAEHAETTDLGWGLLFAENYVRLHTELAGRPVPSQPRYIILQCIQPPRRDAGGQTILVPMEAVRRALTDRQAEILRATRGCRDAGGSPVLRRDHGRDIFVFKDAEGEDLWWRYEGDDPSVTSYEVNDILRVLLGALYEPSAVVGFPWRAWALGAIDNTRFFHGRTFVHRPRDGPPRHLRRVRVRLADPPPGGEMP